jgi:hypothetical protein
MEGWAMVSKDEEVLSVVERHPATQAVFEGYDAQAGECICCNALFQTIEEVAAKYSLDLEVLLKDINRAVRG